MKVTKAITHGDNDSIHTIALDKTSLNSTLGVRVTKKVLMNTGHEATLLELKMLVYTEMFERVTQICGCYCSPNSPIISNRVVINNC